VMDGYEDENGKSGEGQIVTNWGIAVTRVVYGSNSTGSLL